MNRIYRVFGYFVLLGLLASNVFPIAFPETSESRSSASSKWTAQELDDYLQKENQSDAFSGVVLVAEKDKIIFEKAYGIADRSRNISNTIKTRFNLGSVNKMFTAVSIAQLAEKGKLSFNDPIIKYLPDYPNKSVAEKVTIHHLLSHTSGLGTFNRDFMANITNVKTVNDYFTYLTDETPAFEPGNGWKYSNIGFLILGAIIEKVSGENYFDYVKNHVYKPAGMNDTGFYGTKEDSLVAVGYSKQKGEGSEPLTFTPNTGRIGVGGPQGGGYSTAEDMFKFGRALRGHKLLSAKYTDLVMTAKADVPNSKLKYGYGFGSEDYQGKSLVGHNGGTRGVHAQFDLIPESDYTIVILSNYERIQPVINKIRNIVLELPETAVKTENKTPASVAETTPKTTVGTNPEELQKSPQGKAVFDYINAFNSGDVEVMQKYNREHDTEADPDQYMQVYKKHGGFKLHSVVAMSGGNITLLVQNKSRGDWVNIKFVVGEAPPYPITGIGLSRASAP